MTEQAQRKARHTLPLVGALVLALLLRLWGANAEFSPQEAALATSLSLTPDLPQAELLLRLPLIGLGVLLAAWGWRCERGRGALLLAAMSGVPLALLWPLALPDLLLLIFSPSWALGLGLALLGARHVRRWWWIAAALLPLLAGLLNPPLVLLSAPALTLLMAQGSRTFDRENRWIGRGFVLAVALTLATTPLPWPAQGWREMVHTLEALWRPWDSLSLRVADPVLDYYAEPLLRSTPDLQVAWVLQPANQPIASDRNPHQVLSYEARITWPMPLRLLRWQVRPQTLQARWQDGLALGWADLRVERGQVRAHLLWTLHAPASADYTASLALLDESGRLAAQIDSPLLRDGRPTSQWDTETWAYEVRQPSPTDGERLAGAYQAILKLYLWIPDGLRDLPLLDGQPYLSLGQVNLP
ncbi:MAG: hypothetical protein NZ750_04550 [Anaerolineae bacterium]|nr:hypothetical protein [Anaerolineae bacterium]MDW8171217.1 hypothetical protein [Anaerolineae bacterium]